MERECHQGCGLVDDGNIQHGNFASLLDLFCPLDVWVNGVEVIVEWLNVVVVHSDKCVVGFPVPEENELTGTDGIVASGIVGKGCSLKLLHINVRERTAGGFAHAKTLHLFVKGSPPSEIGQVEIEFDESHNVISPDGGSFVEVNMPQLERFNFHTKD